MGEHGTIPIHPTTLLKGLHYRWFLHRICISCKKLQRNNLYFGISHLVSILEPISFLYLQVITISDPSTIRLHWSETALPLASQGMNKPLIPFATPYLGADLQRDSLGPDPRVHLCKLLLLPFRKPRLLLLHDCQLLQILL